MAKFDLHQLLNERSKAAAVERENEPRTRRMEWSS